MLAREAARRDPDHVSLVVTMGSPFASPGSSNASWLWQMITREELPRLPPEQLQRLAAPIPVPATAIYTRGNGVVAWRACLEQPTPAFDQCRRMSNSYRNRNEIVGTTNRSIEAIPFA